MKILTIPDIHGKTIWKSIKIDDYDKIIFLGDYVDSKSKNSTNDKEAKNLLEIIALKKAYPDKITLLLGNHDIQYLVYPKYSCSNINLTAQPLFTQIYVENKDCFQVAFQIKNYLWTHAGLSNAWLNYNFQKDDFKDFYYANFLNDLSKYHIGFNVLAKIGYYRGGSDNSGGIFWADINETKIDYIENLHQIVGHSRVRDHAKVGDENSSITYLDCLDFVEKFYELNIEIE